MQYSLYDYYKNSFFTLEEILKHYSEHQEKFDEAEALLKEMLNDPMSKEFAEGELKYVQQIKQQRN